MFSFLGDLLSSLWNALKKVLVWVLIIAAVILFLFSVFATGGATLAVFGVVFSTTTAMLAAALLLTGAFLIDADEASKVVGKIGDALGDAASAIGGLAGKVAGSFLGGSFSSPNERLAIAGGLYLLTTDDEDTDKSVDPSSGQSTEYSTDSYSRKVEGTLYA